MKSVMEDFADIAARLNQIEQEKLAVVMSAPVDETAPRTPHGIMFDDSGDTAPCEYIGCWPRFDNAINFSVDANGGIIVPDDLAAECLRLFSMAATKI
jgi:hypothetical protein